MKSALRRWMFRGSIIVVGPVALGVRCIVALPGRALDVVVDAVLRRVDLVGIAEDVVKAMDLPGIVRREAGVVASDFVHQARVRGAGADDAVARVRKRLSGRGPVSG